jgi:hypothetical protein
MIHAQTKKPPPNLTPLQMLKYERHQAKHAHELLILQLEANARHQAFLHTGHVSLLSELKLNVAHQNALSAKIAHFKIQHQLHHSAQAPTVDHIQSVHMRPHS